MSKEKGIIQSAEQVRAWLAGTRTQFRVPMKEQPYTLRIEGFGYPTKQGGFVSLESEHCLNECPFGAPGDCVFIKETWCPLVHGSYEPMERSRKVQSYYDCSTAFAADPVYGFGHCWDEIKPSWRPPLTMPRWAARIVREITNVRVERAEQDNPEEKIKAGQWCWVIDTKKA